MEFLVILFIGYVFYILITGSGSSNTYSSSSTQNRNSYVMGDLEAKLQPLAVTLESGDVIDGKKVMVRGFLNRTGTAINMDAVLSLFDITDEKDPDNLQYNFPVVTDIKDMQEKNSRVALIKIPLGKVDPYNGYTKWVEFQRIFPDFLIAAKSGKRKIRGFFRLIPNTQSALDGINYGLRDNEKCPTYELSILNFDMEFKATGYKEAQDNVYKIKSYSVQLAMAIACADGSIDETEATVIKKWITQQIDFIETESEKEKLKRILNESFKKSFEKAKKNDLSISRVLTAFKKITTKAYSTNTLEFLFRVIEADGKIDDKELETVNDIGKKLGISIKEIKDMTDKAFLNAEQDLSQGEYNSESILGLNDNMTNEEKSAILKNEFKKWNGRIQNLPEGDEKEKAQKMLDTISELRSKYG